MPAAFYRMKSNSFMTLMRSDPYLSRMSVSVRFTLFNRKLNALNLLDFRNNFCLVTVQSQYKF